MKIGIITDAIDRSLGGGVASYTRGLIEALKQLHQDLGLIHSFRSSDPVYKNTKELVIPSPLSRRMHAASFLAVHYPLILRKYKFDIIHYPDFRPPFTFQLSGSCTVSTVHSLFPLKHPQYASCSNKMAFKLWALLNRRMDLIITVSLSEKAAIQRFFNIPEEKIRVIYPGANPIFRPLPRTSELNKELHHKFGIKEPYILYVGHYLPKKNLPRLIRAYYRVVKDGLDFLLVIAGKLLWQPQLIKRMVEEFELRDRVLFLDYVKAEELVKLYNGAELFVLPSLEEGFPGALVEAMACGACVATSNISSMPEVAGEAAVYFDPYNVESIAEALRQILINFDLQTKLKVRALKRAKQFNYLRCAQETLDAYKEILKEEKNR